jgi:hypothetical protein
VLIFCQTVGLTERASFQARLGIYIKLDTHRPASVVEVLTVSWAVAVVQESVPHRYKQPKIRVPDGAP